MKRLIALIATLTILGSASCGGAGSGTNPGTYNTQAKVIAAGSIQTAMIVVAYAIEAAFTEYVTNRCDKTTGDVSSFDTSYSSLPQAAADDGTITASYNFTSSSCSQASGTTTFTLDIPQGSLTHSQVVIEATLVDIRMDDIDHLGLEFATTEDKPFTGGIFGRVSGTIETTGSGDEISLSSLNIAESNLSFQELIISFQDNTTGTATLSGLSFPYILTTDNKMQATITNEIVTLSYRDENYSCFNVGGVLEMPTTSTGTTTSTPSEDITCNCTNCQ